MSEIFDKIKKENKPLTPSIELSKKYNGVYLFFSFDLVNSTLFKTLYPDNWPKYIAKFYELAKTIKNIDEEIRVWKYVGDEILFYKKITSFDNLYKVPIHAKKIISKIEKELKEELDNQGKHIQKVNLYIKSTIWLAYAEKITSESREIDSKNQDLRNIIVDTSLDNVESFDFLGPDIDTGFRISKFSERTKIVIDAKLAYLLYKKRKEIQSEHHINIEENLKIVSYESLKGVWHNRKYPIVWYDESWSNTDNMFLYDEAFNSQIISRIESDSFLKNEKYKIKRLEKIFTDLEKEEEIEYLEKTIEEESNKNSPSLQKPYAQVHCVAICFNEKDEILIGKRHSDKEVLPDCWDFGCAKMKDDTFQDCMKRDYKEHFNIDIEFLVVELIPIKTYLIEQTKISGIIFIAKIKNSEETRANKHSEFRYLEVDEELNDLKVNDFDETIKLAREKKRELSN